MTSSSWKKAFCGLFVAGAVAPAAAFAGARPYAFVQGIEQLPQGSLELENWITDTVPYNAAGKQVGSWNWWMGPVAGITEHWEAAAFMIMNEPSTGIPSFSSFRIQTSYLLADRGEWPVDVRLRVEFGQPATSKVYQAWLYVIVGKDFGKLNLMAQLTPWADILKQDGTFIPILDYGLAASYAIPYGIRIGAEMYGSKSYGPVNQPNFGNAGVPSATVGPSIAWARDRFWVSSNFGFGVSNAIASRGRVVIGLAF